MLLVFLTLCTPGHTSASCGAPSMATSTVGLVTTFGMAKSCFGDLTSAGVRAMSVASACALPSAVITSLAGMSPVGVNAWVSDAETSHLPATRVHHCPSGAFSRMCGVLVTAIQPEVPMGASRGSPSTKSSMVGCDATMMVGTSELSPGVELPRAFTRRMSCSRIGRVVVIATTKSACESAVRSASAAGLPSMLKLRTANWLSSTSPGTSEESTSACRSASPVTGFPSAPVMLTCVTRYARAPSRPVTRGWKTR